MNYPNLKKLRERPYFSVEEAAEAFGISRESARVLCSRYVKQGPFIRFKKNFYVLEENWENFQRQDFMLLANFLQVPSYVSFMSALCLYGVTTQAQRDFYESASLKRSVKFEAKGVSFNYYKLKKKLYFDFIKKDGIFIATKEKAFLDAVYLYSFGKYKLDFNSLDLNKLDKKKIRAILKVLPKKTKNIVEKICRI